MKGASIAAAILMALSCCASAAEPSDGEVLPPPQRPGAENRASTFTPYETDIPRRVSDIGLQQAALPGEPPTDLSTKIFTPAPDPSTRRTRGWAPAEYAWVPTDIAYHPLYFQQVALERYGQTLCPCLQPVVSAGQFYGTVLALPGLMVLDCPCSCLYAYGYAPSGSPCQ
jgi:hypothetical protein